jgi:hypothetical protein
MAFRVLIVANGFVQGAPESFPPDVRKLFEQPHEVRVLVPTRTGRLAWLTSDTGLATREASALVSDILADMQRKGIERPPSGDVGDENQLLAIQDALVQFSADAVVVVAHVRGQDSWHERHVIERAREQLGLPVHVVPITANGEVISPPPSEALHGRGASTA